MDSTDTRKRAAAPEGAPQLKRANTQEKEDEKPDAFVLQHQNKALATKLQEQKEEIASLNQQVGNLRTKQNSQIGTIACIERHWSQLEGELSLLLSALEGNGTTSMPDNGGLLELLSQSTSSDLPDFPVDVALQKRCEFTKDLMAKVISAIRSHVHAPSQQGDGTNAPAVVNSEQITKEHATLERINSLSTERDSWKLKSDQLSQELADLQEQLNTSHKKVAKLMTQPSALGSSGCVPIIPCTPPPTPKLTSSAALNSSGSNNTALAAAAVLSTSNATNDTSTTNAQTQAHIMELEAELADANALAAKRAEEINGLKEDRIRLQHELQRMQVELLSDDRVMKSRKYTMLQQHLQLTLNELEGSRMACDRLSRELAAVVAARRADKEKIEGMEGRRIDDLERELKRVDDANYKLKTERDSLAHKLSLNPPSNHKLMDEIKITMNSLKLEVKKYKDERDRLRNEVKRYRDLKDELKLSEDKLSANLDQKDHEYAELLDKYKRAEKKLDDFYYREKKWQEKEAELRGLVESYQSASRDKREIDEIRASEKKLLVLNSKLSEQVAQLEKEKQTSHSASDKTDEHLEKRESRQLAQAHKTIKELQKTLDTQKQDTEALMSEIEVIAKAFEDMQEQNSRLLNQLSEKEDLNMQLMSQKIKATQVQNLLQKEKQALAQKATATEEKCAAQTETLSKCDAKLRVLQEQLAKAGDELRLVTGQIELHKRTARECGQQNNDLKAQLQQQSSVYHDLRRQAEDATRDKEAAVTKVTRLEEELRLVKNKLARITARSNGSDSDVLEEELKKLRTLLTCPVCNDRQKDTVVAKCFHVFCKGCIQTAIQVRNRKCPTCKKPFAESDVHTIYLE